MMEKNNLPKLATLHLNPEEAFKNDQLKALVNQPPHVSWLKKHPLAKKKLNGNTVPSEYLPIDKIEFLLDVIFQEWKVEVLSAQVMLNSIAVTVRLHYRNPINGEWQFHDGVGAKSVQVDQGAHPSNLGAIKDAAVQMALPSAKSYAIKDAAEHIGKLFGRDVNREGTMEFVGSYGHEETERRTTSQPTNNGWAQPEQPPQPVRQQDMPWNPPMQAAGNSQPQPIANDFFSNL